MSDVVAPLPKSKRRAPVLQLVPKVPKRAPPPDSLFDAVLSLSAGVSQGTVTGIAYLAILENGKYTINFAGSTEQHATLTIGGLMRLVGQLDDLIAERDPDDVR